MNAQPTTSRRTAIAIAAILALGAAAAFFIVRGTEPAAAGADSHSHAGEKKSPDAPAQGKEGDHAHGKEEAHGEHDEKNGHGDEKHDHSHEKPAAEAEHDHDHDHAKESGEAHEEGVLQLDAARAKVAGVTLAQAGAASIGNTLQLPGEIRFNDDKTAHVVPRVAGVAESVAANLGQVVKKGQVLATLTSPTVSEQRSELMASQKRLALARTTYQREKQLWQEKISAEQDYLQAQQALREAEIAAANAQQKLAAIGAGVASGGALNRFELRAPFDGVVVEKHLSVGEAVQDSTAVFTISDLRSVWAEMKVAASDLPFVRVGEKATVHATAFESKGTGTVAYVGALIGQETRTAPARITLDNPDGIWRPGLFVNVDLTASSQKAAVTVNSAAIQKIEGEKTVVFVPVQGGFKAQSVKLGKADSRNTEVLQGLSAGQSYVVGGSFVLKSELGKASAEHVH
ncbi:efflux RND transporter periplasmic adaptor subunit [Comamonas sp. 26]|uniref:efflux RND transporter periplasmic adaptor subunit n=1 Tax=Comamonas sp. 26 TaxID=2035201 RepID=UPI000C175B49|nr:efflux RND transporter periplasmic adaptor subunit [Comamonas sp. 26]PIG07347.1 cobalt-zinc-cadmium efflux system membrane fusion protein [Comamonas sp. 26]